MHGKWIDDAPILTITPEGLIQFPPHGEIPAVVLPPRVALSIARQLLACVAAIQGREVAALEPTPLRKV